MCPRQNSMFKAAEWLLYSEVRRLEGEEMERLSSSHVEGVLRGNYSCHF